MEEEVWAAGGARGALPYEEERVVGGRERAEAEREVGRGLEEWGEGWWWQWGRDW